MLRFGGGRSGSGTTIISGAGIPSAGVGSDGNYYLDTTTGVIHGPKTAGAWPSSPAGSTNAFATLVASNSGIY